MPAMGRPPSADKPFSKTLSFDAPTETALVRIAMLCLDADIELRRSDVSESALTRRAIRFVLQQMASGRLSPKRFMNGGE